jgi:adenylate kinase family enzyme
MIMGGGGAGKSTLARKLHEITKLPLFHLDYYYWNDGWVPTDDERFLLMVENMASGNEWIIDGNYSRTIDCRIAKADTIIFLDYSRWVLLSGILKRRIMYNGKTRPDIKEGCPEKLDWEFISWVWHFSKRSGVKQRELLKNVQDKKIFHFRNRIQLNRWLNELEENYKKEREI